MDAVPVKYIYMKNRGEWRIWLEQNHKIEKYIWLVFYKKHTGRISVSYDEAVEEAICFGWIDSTIRRIDEEKYTQKFIRRSEKTKWSELNIKRARKMIESGLMTEAGFDKFENAVAYVRFIQDKELDFPEEMKRRLQSNTGAYNNFQKLAPSYKRNYIGWVISAKKEETKLKRLNELIAVLERGEKLGLK